MLRNQKIFLLIVGIAGIALFSGMIAIFIDASKSTKEYQEEILNRENELENQFKSLQTERDSLIIQSNIWAIEKDSLLKTLREKDGVWVEKSKEYAVKKNNIINNSTNSELADFLSRH